MTAVEVFELTSQGGATDFADVVGICNEIGSYCLIGGLAVNCYVEPVYTMDADLVLVAEQLPQLSVRLADAGFKVDRFPHSINAQRGGSQLRIQFTTDARYEDFPVRATRQTVLGESVMVASLEDLFQGKLYVSDLAKTSKREKDRLDLIRPPKPFELRRLPEPLRTLLP
jgi:hypothetical protein